MEQQQANLSLNDNRCAQRRRMLKDGRIVINKGFSLIDCAIRDVSPSGARLSVKPQCELPSELELLFVTEETLVPCELRWRRGDRLGVKFTGPSRKAPPYRL
jgi:PilZ domain-containing protein